jgi:hypothetical protein
MVTGHRFSIGVNYKATISGTRLPPVSNAFGRRHLDKARP